MNKKILKIAAALAALLLITGVLLVYNAFCGNIFSAMYAKSQIEKHISENFPDNAYEISDARYEFKTGVYICDITDPNSGDGGFTASYAGGGIEDDYELMVTQKENTVLRLETAFRNDVDQIVDSHLSEPDFGFGTIIFGEKDVDRSKLSLDMTFDTKNMPVETCLVVAMHSDAATSLAKMKEILTDLQNRGYRIDCCEYSDSADYYEQIPADRLLAAESSAELAEYRMDGDEKEEAVE